VDAGVEVGGGEAGGRAFGQARTPAVMTAAVSRQDKRKGRKRTRRFAEARLLSDRDGEVLIGFVGTVLMDWRKFDVRRKSVVPG
jgi:hypothetical protein